MTLCRSWPTLCASPSASMPRLISVLASLPRSTARPYVRSVAGRWAVSSPPLAAVVDVMPLVIAAAVLSCVMQTTVQVVAAPTVRSGAPRVGGKGLGSAGLLRGVDRRGTVGHTRLAVVVPGDRLQRLEADS